MTIYWPERGMPAPKRIVLIAEYHDGTAMAFSAEEPVSPTIQVDEPERRFDIGATDLAHGPAVMTVIPNPSRVTIKFEQYPRLGSGIRFQSLTASDVAPAFDAIAPKTGE